MINQRLFDWYKIDTNKDLKIKAVCPRPYDTILIDKNGSCYACECTSWLPQSIGNLQLKSLDEIIDSSMHKHLQDSIADRTYRYCNNNQCSYLLDDRGPRAGPKGRPLWYNEGRSGSWPWQTKKLTTQIKHIRLAIDDSCNLRCPSCRKDLIFHKEGSAFKLGIKLADKINDWLHTYKHPIQVHIGSDGDPFASHVYRYFMEQTPERDNIKYSILTNGLMFKELHTKIPYVINNLQELGVSIDGASKETYEKLRLGGSWEKINQNLKCISELKEKHNFRFILHFVVQKDNYHEMEDIIHLGQQYNADRIWLTKIQDWNTFDNFEEHNIFNSAHPLHSDYEIKLASLKEYNKSLNENLPYGSSAVLVEFPTLT
jgi:MoaA/NifB/PqqE/SkfB family radical SAM enzyme